jgi:hypothetical protein
MIFFPENMNFAKLQKNHISITNRVIIISVWNETTDLHLCIRLLNDYKK